MTTSTQNTSGSLCIYGAGLLGRQIVHSLKHYSDYDLLGFIDDTMPIGSPVQDQLCCLGGLEYVKNRNELSPDNITVCFAIGYADMKARNNAYKKIKAAGYVLSNVVHPKCLVEPGVEIGEGSIILGGAIVDQGVKLGNLSYVDIGVRIGENSQLGDNNYISAGVGIGGSVCMGYNNFIGMDSTITTDVSIGSNCFVNAKSLISSNLADNTRFVELHKSKKLPN